MDDGGADKIGVLIFAFQWAALDEFGLEYCILVSLSGLYEEYEGNTSGGVLLESRWRLIGLRRFGMGFVRP